MSLVYVGVIQWIVVVRVVRIKFVGAFFLRLIAQIYSFFSPAKQAGGYTLSPVVWLDSKRHLAF